MRRRDFLRLTTIGAGALVAGSLVPSCLRRASSPPASVPPPFRALNEKLGSQAELGLAVFPGGSEFVSGTTERIALRLMDDEGRSFESLAAKIYVGQEKVEGPFDVRFRHFGSPSSHRHEDGSIDVTEGFYEAFIPVPGEGTVDLAVVAEHERSRKGSLYGFAVVEAKAAPKVPAPGQPAVSTPTPTVAEPGTTVELCTRQPPCPMHETSLADALLLAKPVVLLIGSPKFCSSGVCGPVIEEVLAVRDDNPSAEFIHVEPYRDGQAAELSAAASAWRLDSEPWTFIIDPEGKVAGRFEGAVVAGTISEALRKVV